MGQFVTDHINRRILAQTPEVSGRAQEGLRIVLWYSPVFGIRDHPWPHLGAKIDSDQS